MPCLRADTGVNMKEFAKKWEEREYGPKLAMAAISAMIVYLVIAQ